jgi:hypothetical protein
LSMEDVRQLRGRYGGFSVREPEMDPDDQVWRGMYAKMREAFERAAVDRSGHKQE